MKCDKERSCLQVDGDIRSVEDIYQLVDAVKEMSVDNKEFCFCCDHNITIPSSVIRQLEKEAERGKKVTVNSKSEAVVKLLHYLDQAPHKLAFQYHQA